MAAGSVTSIGTLSELRGRLSSSEQKIIRRCSEAAEKQMIGALRELLDGLEVSGRQSSLSITVTLKKQGRHNVALSVAPRVRAAREAEEFEVHVTDDRQLELGWIDEEDGEHEAGTEDGEWPEDAFGRED